ncbi:uncharacterized protein [Rutidosis leptorrhynchoides]|uniref:uncharacterized protein n=1 Tax=Rutidosis leptorrhynchoides TaxID=125765 RepID=UPI003A99D015
MKIMSYNIRSFGLGKNSKFGALKKLILKEKPSFFALQETKLESVDDRWVNLIWGSLNCNFIQQDKIGKSGGQLLIWDSSLFEATDVIKFDRVIGVRGKWKDNGSILNVLNIYGPHDERGKQSLWDSLSNVINSNNEAWVLCGDFNEVRTPEERLNCVFVENRAKKFNEFIQANNLLEIPMGGRSFTRVCDNGIKFSKLDRFLVSEPFLLLWRNLTAVVMERTDSDHCPISLSDDERNFGPKLVKVFDAWLDNNDAELLIQNTWAACSPPGPRRDRQFLSKLKMVKAALIQWSSQQFGSLDSEIDDLKTKAQALELKA